jgi:hypothetical protein
MDAAEKTFAERREERRETTAQRSGCWFCGARREVPIVISISSNCLGGCILVIDDWEARVISSLEESREKRSMTLRPSAFSRTTDKSTALVVHVGDSQWLRVPSVCRTQLSNCDSRLLTAQFAN